MKTAIYIEDGVVQLVITPQTEFEKNALRSFDNNPLEAELFAGSFYDCRGGWTRQTEIYPALHGVGKNEDRSLILRMKPKEAKTPGFGIEER